MDKTAPTPLEQILELYKDAASNYARQLEYRRTEKFNDSASRRYCERCYGAWQAYGCVLRNIFDISERELQAVIDVINRKHVLQLRSTGDNARLPAHQIVHNLREGRLQREGTEYDCD